MAKVTLAKDFWKLSKFLLFVVVLIVIGLTLRPVFATMNPTGGGVDEATAKVLEHMEKMEQNFPEIQVKKMEVEEKLSNGTITPHGACSHCHIAEPGGP